MTPKSRKRLHAAADRAEPRLVLALVGAFAKMRTRVTISSMVRLLSQRDVKGAVALLEKAMMTTAMAPTRGHVLEAFERGGKIGVLDVREGAVDPRVQFKAYLASL